MKIRRLVGTEKVFAGYAAILFLSVLIVGVDVPYRDEWDAVVPLVIAARRGLLNVKMLLAGHNEHHIVLPRLLFLGLSYPKLNFINLMLASASFHLVSLYIFWRGSANTGRLLPAFTVEPMIWITAVSLFGCFYQRLNFFMGMQLFWTLALASVAYCLYSLTRKNYRSALIGLSISLLCMPLGVAVLPVGLFLFRKSWMNRFGFSPKLVALAGALILSGLVFYWFKNPASVAGWRYLQFFLMFLGGPLAQYQKIPAALLGILFCVMTGWLSKQSWAQSSYALLWCLFTVISAAIISFGRTPFGVEYAFGSHYAGIVLPGWASLFIAGVCQFPLKKQRAAFSIVVLILSLGLSAKELGRETFRRAPELRLEKNCLRLSPENKNCPSVPTEIYPWRSFAVLRQTTLELSRLGIWRVDSGEK
jgi:hypothetical protein